MKKIYLVDYIGVHCGMHYYLEAFKQVLSKIPDVDIEMLSNYSDKEDEGSFFYNQYKGNIISKGLALILNILKFKRFVKQNKNSIYIYLTYGNWIDIPFIKIVSKVDNHIIDIHEAIAQNVDADEKLKNKFQSIYKNCVKNVISHSTRTDEFLREYGFRGKRFEVPHFRYVFSKQYEKSKIQSEILDSLEFNKTNLLFFGNININKGIDILIESINMLPKHVADRINLIIAGKDFDGSIDKVPIKDGVSVKIFRRHISDDELIFLYKNIDFIVLPYRKTSQSGILEMAFYFKKPIIASDIPYFREMLLLFPSFGLIAGNTPKSFADTISKIISDADNKCYFKQEDYDRYRNRIEINKFIRDISEWIKLI